ncbi:MAG TPA: hydroxyphenylacetyl-CoA thioesterase PaaI [Gemmatimonadaceae bacterium]
MKSKADSRESNAGPQALAERVVRGMLAKDAFSEWLGIEALEIAPRRSMLRMKVRKDMVNGFGVAHGGIVYSLADSALAFACNTHGTVTVALENSISYPAPVNVGDVLTAESSPEAETNRIQFHRIIVKNQNDVVVAVFRGTVYDTKREHE